uniref:Large ribosomal subunit protein mL62 n=1 Tax=Scytodes thoracica TaxID=1112478 RepID=A0A0A0V600_SCYTH|nr:peptidyl-tRNA hydrolase [Scytodes thoracica]
MMISRCWILIARNNVSAKYIHICNFNSSARFLDEFKSAYSLDRLHPQSSLRIDQPKGATIKDSEFSGYIPVDDLIITYSRSSGPGGQHVNKVNTKCMVRFKINDAKWIPESVKPNLMKLHENSITKEGYFVVKSDKTRMQTLNLADCMDKIRCYVREAAKPPPEVLPETLELMKKRQERAAAIRLRDKRQKSMIKNSKREGLNVDF